MRRAASRSLVGGVGRVGVREVQREAQRQARVAATQLLDHHAVAEEQVVSRPQRSGRLPPARRVLPTGVPEEGGAPRLVERRPGLHPVAEHVVDRQCVLDEPVGGVPLGPAATLLQSLRKVPVVEREPRPDAGLEELVDET
jgi:hypothetical protein